MNNEMRTMTNRAIPWIGIHAANLKRNRKKVLLLVISFLCLFVISYMFYGVVFSLWEEIFLGGKPSMLAYEQSYYIYLEIMEFMILLFIRTRVSILYFPKIITLMNIIYLFYSFSNFLPFTNLAVGILISTTFIVFLLFIKFCELPAIQQNPFALHVPSSNEPRQVYITVSKYNVSLGIDIWSIFFPPSLRSEFIAEEQKDIVDEIEPNHFDFSQLPNPINVDM